MNRILGTRQPEGVFRHIKTLYNPWGPTRRTDTCPQQFEAFHAPGYRRVITLLAGVRRSLAIAPIFYVNELSHGRVPLNHPEMAARIQSR